MDKTIFEVEISNSGPKSYETATVMKMPASFAEFSDALQKARIKDGSFCKNELTCIHYNGLTHAMIGWNANLYDLNLFAQRLASLTEEQKKGMDPIQPVLQFQCNKEKKMKFNKQINNGTLLIPGGAFKISGFEGGEKVEIHTLDSAVVVLKKQMTTMELIQAMDALHRLATELTVHLARVCGTCDDCEDGCPFDHQ